MTIGKTSRMSSVRSSLRAPKFLDKANGFYGRLDEPAGDTGERGAAEEKQNDAVNDGGPTTAPHRGKEERGEAAIETFDFSEGLMEDDGETLLRRKPSRRSSRWRRSSRRKQKEAKPEEDAPQDGRPSPGTESGPDGPAPEVTAGAMPGGVGLESMKKETEGEEGGRGTREPAHIHFREEEDDQVLIRDKKRGREEEEEEEGEEERRMRREQEEGMKVVKRNTVKNYRKALDRAFRRGWEAFVTNLYSVTLTPVTSSSSPSPSSKTKHQHNVALAEFR